MNEHESKQPAVTERQLITEREAARERLRASVDALTQQASLQVQMQKEPLKMIGGASAVGAVLGLVVGRQFRRSKKIYVDADSPAKYQKALIKAQKTQKGGGGIGGALVATLGTLAVKTLTERVITPKLEQLSNSLLDRAGQNPAVRDERLDRGRQVTFSEVDRVTGRPASFDGPVTGPVTLTTGEGGKVIVKEGAVHTSPATAAFLKGGTGDHDPKAEAPDFASSRTGGSPAHSVAQRGEAGGTVSAMSPVTPVHPGVVPMPESQVEAKAVGTPISDTDRRNPAGSGTLSGATQAANTGPTGPTVTPTHAGVVRMPDSQVDAKATGTPIDATQRGNPNQTAHANTAAVQGTGPVVTPAHAGVVRMPDSQVDAKATGIAIPGEQRGNPNRR